jgi:hypothetical protein
MEMFGGGDVGLVWMPNTLNPSMESLQDDGLYLIDDGIHIYLYIGKLVPDEIKHAATCSDENTRIQEIIGRLV